MPPPYHFCGRADLPFLPLFPFIKARTMTASIGRLSIIGHDNAPLPHSFIRQEPESTHLAVFFPGVAYSPERPALYYPARLLGDMGADLLQLERLYRDFPGFGDMTEGERARVMVTDALSACETALRHREYRRITLVGKSIGTLVMARLLKLMPAMRQADCVWLTPVLDNERMRRMLAEVRPRSLFVIGTADSFYHPELLREVERETEGKSLVMEGGDHSLEIPGSVANSIRWMESIIEGISMFLEGDR